LKSEGYLTTSYQHQRFIVVKLDKGLLLMANWKAGVSQMQHNIITDESVSLGQLLMKCLAVSPERCYCITINVTCSETKRFETGSCVTFQRSSFEQLSK
jgi:hypothetical protein